MKIRTFEEWNHSFVGSAVTSDLWLPFVIKKRIIDVQYQAFAI
jgi:hypothetical protein